MKQPISLALPKGRLYEKVQAHLEQKGVFFKFENRKLVAFDKEENLKIYLVKNSDLPTYVAHGIAGLGVCGEDVIEESNYDFLKLLPLPFGGTSLSLAAKKGTKLNSLKAPLTIATSYTNMTRKYFHEQDVPVKIIKLNGSVELAPLLGLAPCIVDLVETGSTLKANDLEVIQKLREINVFLISNPAYYKLNYQEINRFIQLIKES